MKTKVMIAVRIVITLLMVAPVVLLAVENLSMRPITAPGREFVKAWDVQDDTHDGRLHFTFSIREDGTVEGTVGTVDEPARNVRMLNAYLKRNRHWFSKLLGRRRDYKVEGRLESSPVEEPREGFWIEFNFDRKGTMTRIKAGLHD